MRKTPLAVGVAILLVAVSVGAAALLLTGSDGPTRVSAAAACNLMNTPYDALLTSTTPIGEVREEIRYSGSDEHIVTRVTDHEGVLLGKFESITKDRTNYYRESAPDNPEGYGEWLVAGIDLPRSFPLPCLDTSSFEEGASGSSDEPHFTSERFLSEGEGAERNEFWADSTGRPTRARVTHFLPDYDEVTNTGFFVTEFTYSDYGQPNIIEAPCAGAAPNQSDNPGLMRDCVNLLAAKDTLRGAATLNWGVETAITSWDGVRVLGSPGRVTSLALTSKSLTGTIPPDLARLDGLEHLRLNINQLTGTIPAALGDVASLESLLLNENQLTGEVPAELGGLASLESLWLHKNQLSGEVPPELGDLNNLRQLALSGNRLTGAIPSELGDLSNLEILWLHDNQLTGEIPASLGSLTNLQKLSLSNNQLTGCIPPALRTITENDLDSLGLQNCATP